jgi:Tfp pilus assembly protein PilN
MINLLSPQQQRDIRSARINVVLLNYVVALAALCMAVGGVFAIGFWLVAMDQQTIQERLAQQAKDASGYSAVVTQAKDFRGNLQLAKKILDKQTTYSSFLTQMGHDMPSGTIITALDLGDDATSTAKTGITIQARTADYTKALELKAALEKSVLFENVNITSITRPDDITKLTGLEQKYPNSLTLNARLSAQKVNE